MSDSKLFPPRSVGEGLVMGFVLGAILLGVSYLFGWAVIGPDTRAVVEIRKVDDYGFSATVEIQERGRMFWHRHWYKDTEWLDILPGIKAAYLEALVVAESYGAQNRIVFDQDSIIDDSFVFPDQTNVKAIVYEYRSGEAAIRLESADYDTTSWRYFNNLLNTPGGGIYWPSRQLALEAATATAEKYDLHIVQVVDE